MPYIHPEQREALDECIFDLAEQIESAGELSYALTKIALICAMNSSADTEVYASIIGALEVSKQEMFRRVIAGHLDAEIAKHGDLFDEREERFYHNNGDDE